MIRTLPVYPGRELPEVSFLAGSPAEAIALAYIAARQVPEAAQGAGSQPGDTAAACVSSEAGPTPANCAGAGNTVPAAFSGEAGCDGP